MGKPTRRLLGRPENQRVGPTCRVGPKMKPTTQPF